MGLSFRTKRSRLTLPESELLHEFGDFWLFFWDYSYKRVYRVYRHFESGKSLLVDLLYQRRGKYARPFMHVGMVGLVFIGVTVGPVIIKSNEDQIKASELPQAEVIGMGTDDTFQMGMRTVPSEGVVAYRGGEIIDYTVQSGETLSQIAEKHNLKVETMLWANGLDNAKVKIREGQTLKIPPVDGVIHKVQKGETVYSIAKKYTANPQAMVDYPFNEFTNDETFALAVGQTLMVPDGVMPEEIPELPKQYFAQQVTPSAGQVSALGSFVWPASGVLSQRFSWFHKAIDIAAATGNPILAADSGRVAVAGWPDNSGYGNRVIIDHGNGYTTLYAHMSRIAVVAGQTVNRGDVIGSLGSTGRSTGPHVHFEIRVAGGLQNPLNFLK